MVILRDWRTWTVMGEQDDSVRGSTQDTEGQSQRHRAEERTGGVISAGHSLTAEAGKFAFEAGGNAFDAAVAALLASFVAEPCMSSPGGGFHAVLRTSEAEVGALDAFCSTPGRTPGRKEIEFFPVEIDFGDTLESFQVGRASVAVPGAIPGMLELHTRFCTLPLDILAQPAVQAAGSGIAVDHFQAYDFELLSPILRLSEEADHFFEGGHEFGTVLSEGAMLRQGALAGFLQDLSDGRFQDIRAWADLLVESVSDGGLLATADITSYRPVWREPVTLSQRGRRLYLNPAPSSGGSVVGLAMAMLGDSAIQGSAAPIQVARAIRRALQLRTEIPSRQERQVIEQLWGDHIYQQAPDLEAPGGTTHFSVVDTAGNAIALSSTNGEGSGIWIPGTGIQLNNMLGEAALFPDGFHTWKPGVRVSSLMSPTLLEDQRAGICALGTGGAGRIPWAITQVLINLARTGLQQAVEAPRLYDHHGQLQFEPGLDPGEQLDEEVNRWARCDMFFGGINTVMRSMDGELDAVADKRRFGSISGTQ